MGSPRVRIGVTFYIWKESVLHISRLVQPHCWKVHPDHRLGQIFLLGPTGRPVRKSISPLTTFLRRVSGRERRALGRWLSGSAEHIVGDRVIPACPTQPLITSCLAFNAFNHSTTSITNSSNNTITITKFTTLTSPSAPIWSLIPMWLIYINIIAGGPNCTTSHCLGSVFRKWWFQNLSISKTPENVPLVSQPVKRLIRVKSGRLKIGPVLFTAGKWCGNERESGC